MKKILCPREKCPNKARHHLRLGILPCLSCQTKDRETTLVHPPEFATQAQTNRISEERSKNAKDILQPFTGKNMDPSKEFVDAYPERARDYFSEKQLKRL